MGQVAALCLRNGGIGEAGIATSSSVTARTASPGFPTSSPRDVALKAGIYSPMDLACTNVTRCPIPVPSLCPPAHLTGTRVCIAVKTRSLVPLSLVSPRFAHAIDRPSYRIPNVCRTKIELIQVNLLTLFGRRSIHSIAKFERRIG